MIVLHLNELRIIFKYKGIISDLMQIIAHRGASKHAPENTLEAFTLAYQKGIDFIECDVAMSQDGILFIIHDDTLNRTTNGRGPVGDLQWSTISQLDAGSWFSLQYQHAKIPSLEDLLQWQQKHPVKMNLELKTIPSKKIPLFLDALFKAMEKISDMDQFIFSSFQFELLEALKERKKDWPIAALSMRCSHAGIQSAKKLGCQWYSTCLKSCHLSWVETIHAAGMKVGVFTVNDVEQLEQLKSWGVDFIFTDDVELLMRC